MIKLIFAFISCFIVFNSFSQVEDEELDDEYVERSYDEVEEERGNKQKWIWHPNPLNFKGNIYFENYDENHVAIMGDGKILLLENITDDTQIVGEWSDYYIVYSKSTRKLVVKGRTGKPISSMLIPPNCDVIGLFKDGMTDYEIMYTKHAFDVENFDTNEVRRYDKFCKLLSVR